MAYFFPDWRDWLLVVVIDCAGNCGLASLLHLFRLDKTTAPGINVSALHQVPWRVVQSGYHV